MKKFKVNRVPTDQFSQCRSLAPYVEIFATGVVSTAGEISMSPNLMTSSEIDEAIDSLVAELNQLRSEAKKAL